MTITIINALTKRAGDSITVYYPPLHLSVAPNAIQHSLEQTKIEKKKRKRIISSSVEMSRPLRINSTIQPTLVARNDITKHYILCI